jgi:hypothetical protein
MTDGTSGVELVTMLMSLSPDEREPGEVSRYVPRPPPGNLELLRDEVARYAAGPLDAARRIRSCAARSPACASSWVRA